MTDVETVKNIVEKQLESRECVSKFYIVELLKTEIHPTRLYNKVLTYNGDTGDGVKNMHEGAKKIFRDAMRNLKRLYSVDEHGLIRRHQKGGGK